MGNFLHKLGEKSFDRHWLVIVTWLIIIAIVGGLAGHYYKQPSDSISIPGTSAQKTLDEFGEIFPDAGKGTGRIVYEAKDGSKIADNKASINKTVDKLSSIEGVSNVTNPFTMDDSISNDKKVAYSTISLDSEIGDIDQTTFDGVSDVVESAKSPSLDINMAGDVINKVPGDIIGVGEISGVVLALFVLIIALGSLVAAGMPIMIALVTVAGGVGGLFSLSHVIDISSTTPVLAVMLGLAVGIDYSLFIVNKYRHYLLQGFSYKDAAAKSVATAGNAVIFAATTVVIALASLVVVRIPFMTSMGLSAAATVALAALVAVTLLPALFGLAKQRVFFGKTKKRIIKAQSKGPHESHRVDHTTIWYKVGNFISKKPIIVLLISVVVVAAIAWPMKSLTLGLPSDQYAAKDTTERQAYDAMTRGFGEGYNSPLIVLAQDIKPVSDQNRQDVRDEVMSEYNKEVKRQKDEQTAKFKKMQSNVKTEKQAVLLQKKIAQAKAQAQEKQKKAKSSLETTIDMYSERYNLSKISDNIEKLDGVKKATPILVNDDTTKGAIQVIPEHSPSSESTNSLIENLRSKSTVKNVSVGGNMTLGVTGSTALQQDINKKLASVLPEYLLIVVGLSLVILVVVFRSILVPIKATLGFLLSVAAMFGAIVAVFQWGWLGITDAPGPIVSFLPIIAIGVLFGLAMDYEFFLVSSIHEEYTHNKNAKTSVVNGYAVGSRVVVAAAIIMVAVFASFVSNSDQIIQTIGFGLAVGIFVDAFIVRLLIVPAVMSLIGKAAWWIPKWLERILPHISIEGEE